MVLTSEAFSLTGLSVDFTKQMNISAETGSFALTGQDALKGIGEAFDVGTLPTLGKTSIYLQKIFTARKSKLYN